MKVSDFIMQELEKCEVRTIFSLVGGYSMHLIDSLGQSNIKPVYMLHEQSCSFAAEAYAQLTGLGVCLVTEGAGAVNAVAGCAAAWNNNSPVLFISGQVKTTDVMKVNIVEIVKPITKYAKSIRYPNEILKVLPEAILQATTDPFKPCWIDLPLDMQSAEL
jgi:acetolactate synthase I/II/III large subunit